MPFFGASDIDAMIRDFGVVVVVGAVSSRGLEDAVDEEMLRQERAHLIGRVRTVIVKTGTFALDTKGTISVDGSSYKIHSLEQLDDGALTRVTCVELN